jgi:SHS2 domain-containing protein
MEGEGYSFEEHTSDVIIVARGKTLERAFEYIAKGLMEIMTNPSQIDIKEKKELKVNGFDLENLLYRWVEEFLYLFDAEGFLAREIKVEKIEKLNEEYLVNGVAYGERYNERKHESRTHVKAPTYSQINVTRESDLWKLKKIGRAHV